MLVVILSDKETTDKATTEIEKLTNMKLTDTLWAKQNRDDIEKISIEIWAESPRFDTTSQTLADINERLVFCLSDTGNIPKNK